MNRLLLLLFLFGIYHSFAQQQSGWVIQPFSEVGFIENVDRYSEIEKEEVRYYAEFGQNHFYFANNTIVLGELLAPKGGKSRKHPEKFESEEDALLFQWNYIKIEFLDCNQNSRLKVSAPKNHTVNYRESRNSDVTIKAPTFDTLTYENLYSGIDLILTLTGNGGLKYYFEVSPNVDPEIIQMFYSGADLELEENGDLRIDCGKGHGFRDAAPVSSNAGDHVFTKFSVENNLVTFELDAYDSSETLIIDPWIVPDLPFDPINKGYEVEYDNAGNCVILGNWGGKIALYDNMGVLQWVWIDPLADPGGPGAVGDLGDITVNRANGDVYYVMALVATNMVRLDVTGTLIGEYFFDYDLEVQENFRLVFDHTHDEVWVGGGHFDSAPDLEKLSADFVLTEVYDILDEEDSNPVLDVVLLEMNPTNDTIYFLSANDYIGGTYGNHLICVSRSDPTTVIWESETHHEFLECLNVSYYGLDPDAPAWYNCNGFNGIAASNHFLYTYDGNRIQKYNKSTGEILDSLFLMDEEFSHAGIDTDDCGNLYVGANDSVLVFDLNLVPMGGIAIPDTCYDLIINGEKLYVTGKNFVTEIAVPLFEISPELNSTAANCGECNGTASIALSSCDFIAISPESVVWEPGGIEGEMIENLCPGWYVATITWINDFGEELTLVDSIEVISGEEGIEVEIEVVNETCSGNCDGMVVIIPIAGVAPFTFTLDGVSNATGIFEDLCNGEYPITVVGDNGCDYTAMVTVESGVLEGEILFSNPTCYGFADGSVTIDLTDPMGGEVIEIRNPEGDLLNVGGSNTANTLAAGWYYYFIDLGGGCVLEDSVQLFDPPAIDAILDVINPPCHGDSTGVVVVDTVFNAQGDYGEIVYIWAPDPEELSGVGADSAYGLPIGDYSLIINDDNGCSRVLEFTLTEPDPLVFVELGFEPAFCRLYGYQNGNGVVYAAASGGIPDYEYEWLNLETGDVSDNSTWGGLNPGAYEITVTDEHGCELVEIIDLDSLNPIAAFAVESDQLDANCEGTELVIANFVNQSQYFADPKDPDADTTFLWNLDFPTANWMISHDFFEEFDSSYVGEDIYQVCLIALNKNGCADTTCKDLIVHVKPEFVAPNIFTPGNGGANDLFTFEFLTLGIAEFHCEIVNRWGVTVGEINDISEGWDGTNKNGGDCPDGVYFYVYTAVATNKTVFTGQGTVQLVR